MHTLYAWVLHMQVIYTTTLSKKGGDCMQVLEVFVRTCDVWSGADEQDLAAPLVQQGGVPGRNPCISLELFLLLLWVLRLRSATDGRRTGSLWVLYSIPRRPLLEL